MTPRSTLFTALWNGVLWMGADARPRSDRFPSRAHSVPESSSLPDAFDSVEDATNRLFPPFSQPCYYGFEDSTLRFYALSFLPAAPRTHR
jgi:hypothetical protein